MFFVEDKNFLNEKQIKHINDNILNVHIPWFFQKNTVKSKKQKPYLSHTVLRRPEERKKGEEFNSIEASFCIDVLNSFCKKNNIKYKELLRIAFNLSYNNGFEKCDVHKDHDYDHKQLIVYLNNCDKQSYTVIKNNKKEIKIKPERFKGVCFENKPHYHYFPKEGTRVILIITFK